MTSDPTTSGPTSTDEVRALLRAVLTPHDFAGRAELLEQARAVEVTGGSATFPELRVRTDAPRARIPDGPIPLSINVDAPDGSSAGELLVWVTAGAMDAIEYAWWTDDAPTGLPSPGALHVAVRRVPSAPEAPPQPDAALSLSDAILADGIDGPVPLSAIYRQAHARMSGAPEVDVRRAVVAVVRDLVANGLAAIGDVSPAGVFTAWAAPIFELTDFGAGFTANLADSDSDWGSRFSLSNTAAGNEQARARFGNR